MNHNTARPGRYERAKELLTKVPAALRPELVSLIPELRRDLRGLVEELRLVNGWPADHKPFLTPAEFAVFIKPLLGRYCKVILIDGSRFTGLLLFDGNAAHIGAFAFKSDCIADLVCNDPQLWIRDGRGSPRLPKVNTPTHQESSASE